MAKRKPTTPDAEKVTDVDLSTQEDMTVIIWKATRPLTIEEHEHLSAKLRYESKESGIPIVLVPYSVDAEEGAVALNEGETDSDKTNEAANQPDAKDPADQADDEK
jgi:hypothetical protein